MDFSLIRRIALFTSFRLYHDDTLTLNVDKLSTPHSRTASLPMAAVTFAMGAVNFGSETNIAR